jgi:hypothetical protein
MTDEYDGGTLHRRIARQAEKLRLAAGKVVYQRAYVKVTLGFTELYCRFFDVGTAQETDAAEKARAIMADHRGAQWAVSVQCVGALKECPVIGADAGKKPVDVTRRGLIVLEKLERGEAVKVGEFPKIALRLARLGFVEHSEGLWKITPQGVERLKAG